MNLMIVDQLARMGIGQILMMKGEEIMRFRKHLAQEVVETVKESPLTADDTAALELAKFLEGLAGDIRSGLSS